MTASFTPLFGFVPDDKKPAEAKFRYAVERAPIAYDSGFRNPLLVQQFSDCVPRSTANAMRRSMVMRERKKPLAERLRDEDIPLPSSRWGYWHWLEATGRLGLTDSGTQPELYVQLLRDRGWCREEHMPYAEPDGTVPSVDDQNAPSLQAYRFSVDQRNRFEAHFISAQDGNALRLALAHDLAVCIAIACDERFVSPDGIPHDEGFTWDFDDALSEVGRHMMEAVAYDERGLLCQNTWGPGFAHGGYVRVGWKTIRRPEIVAAAMVIDHTPLPSDAERLLRSTIP